MVCLIRHGQTSANEEHRYCGRTDLPLSANGLCRLHELKATGICPSVDCCYHSGLSRAQQTASIYFQDTPMIEMAQFREFDFGDFELHSYEELKDNPVYLHWIDQIETESCPNGESYVEFKLRVLDGWSCLLSDIKSNQTPDQQKIAVVTHGGVIATLMDHLFPGQRHFYAWQPACGEGYRIEIRQDQAIRFSEICVSTAEGNC